MVRKEAFYRCQVNRRLTHKSLISADYADFGVQLGHTDELSEVVGV
jgi:hypothetical protein